jgi:hypothetical protein
MHVPYSFVDRDIEGSPWDLRRLHGSRQGRSYAPAWLLERFVQVLAECIRR